MYRVFVRNWWKRATLPGWPQGLEPDPTARKHTIARVATETEARAICQRYNDSHEPGRYNRKAEYTREG